MDEVALQVVYAVAAVLLYILIQHLNDLRKQNAQAKQQHRLERQQPEVQHRGDSARDSVGVLPYLARSKDVSARPEIVQVPTLPPSVFIPEPSMLELPSLPSDWEVKPDQLSIAKRPDGSPWELGTGAFGKVSQQE